MEGRLYAVERVQSYRVITYRLSLSRLSDKISWELQFSVLNRPGRTVAICSLDGGFVLLLSFSMISRAVRVPRICLACRFGLITQRSASLGFRPHPVREGIGRRLYTSDIGNTGDGRIESFVSEKDVPKRNSEQEPVEEESTTTTTTPSKGAVESTNSAPATETDSKST